MNGPDLTWGDLMRAFWGGQFTAPGPAGQNIMVIEDRGKTVIAFRGCAPVFPDVEGKPAAPALRLLQGEGSG